MAAGRAVPYAPFRTWMLTTAANDTFKSARFGAGFGCVNWLVWHFTGSKSYLSSQVQPVTLLFQKGDDWSPVLATATLALMWGSVARGRAATTAAQNVHTASGKAIAAVVVTTAALASSPTNVSTIYNGFQRVSFKPSSLFQ